MAIEWWMYVNEISKKYKHWDEKEKGQGIPHTEIMTTYYSLAA